MRRARVVIVCGACVVVALVAVAITSSSRGRPQVHERSSRVLRASTAHARATARATGSAVSRLAATTVLGTGRAGSAGARGAGTATELYGPGGIALDAAGDLFVADTGNCRVLEVPATSGTHFGIHMLGGHAYVIAGGSCSTKGRATQPPRARRAPEGPHRPAISASSPRSPSTRPETSSSPIRPATGSSSWPHRTETTSESGCAPAR